MIDRIKNVIDYSQLSSSAFADTIGISRSGLTHLLTGRNQPSLDVARKILAKFPEISTEWLIMGMGEMLRPDEQFVAPSFKIGIETSPAGQPVENLKSDRQINLFGEFENPENPEADMHEDMEVVAESDNVAAVDREKYMPENVDTISKARPMVAETRSEISETPQTNVRKSTEYRLTTPVKRDRRQSNITSERKLQKIVFFYDDHSFEVYNS